MKKIKYYLGKNGVSPVIATVLLIVITVIIASIIMSFVLPFVNDELDDSKACLDVLDGIEFGVSNFNCFDEDTTLMETGFSVKIKKEGIESFKVSLIDDVGSSEVYDISDGIRNDNLRMVGTGSSGYNAELDYPSVGGQKSYVVKKKYKSAEISAIINNNQVCSVADRIEFLACVGNPL